MALNPSNHTNDRHDMVRLWEGGYCPATATTAGTTWWDYEEWVARNRSNRTNARHVRHDEMMGRGILPRNRRNRTNARHARDDEMMRRGILARNRSNRTQSQTPSRSLQRYWEIEGLGHKFYIVLLVLSFFLGLFLPPHLFFIVLLVLSFFWARPSLPVFFFIVLLELSFFGLIFPSPSFWICSRNIFLADLWEQIMKWMVFCVFVAWYVMNGVLCFVFFFRYWFPQAPTDARPMLWMVIWLEIMVVWYQ